MTRRMKNGRFAKHPAQSGVVGAAYMPPCEPEGEMYLAPTPGGSGRRPGTRGSCLVEESASERVADELRAGLETELLHDVRAVRLGRADRGEGNLAALRVVLA